MEESDEISLDQKTLIRFLAYAALAMVIAGSYLVGDKMRYDSMVEYYEDNEKDCFGFVNDGTEDTRDNNRGPAPFNLEEHQEEIS